ncbi:hypothetical protein P775_10685 [Puniceibacterium antarcticum]|uniref:Uncharacterized protein n=1 Tax=Puniceibacterium antarcticum TaxID=1206336 RepID=A0A2G8REV5_9RHOB|nr:hypothetical protein P775_10685 [Puniceibacterium antarcticum]
MGFVRPLTKPSALASNPSALDMDQGALRCDVV